MCANVSIDIDQHTANVFEARAAELDRRVARATPDSRVPQDRVVQWLRTWGTPEFRPSPDP